LKAKTTLLCRCADLSLLSDLLIEMTDREREAGMVVQRPVPGRHMPFAGDFDQFLAAWTFLNGMRWVCKDAMTRGKNVERLTRTNTL
jgi:hypothetical protein